MTEKEALTIFRTIQKCRHQAHYTNDCGDCEGCKYYHTQKQIDGAVALAISALEKQETAKIVVGKSRGGVTLWHECSKCGEPVDAKDIFCRRCGRRLIPLPEPYTEDES